MNLKMKTLAAAMIAAGTLGTAQASQALFPYVVNSSTVTTIITVIDGLNSGSAVSSALHYSLWYKEGAAAEDNNAKCIEVNQYLPSSTFDVQTIDLGARFGAATKGVLFNDPSNNNKWAGANFAMANLVAKPMRGYLVIDNELGSSGNFVDGEAMVFEFSTGAAWGYQAGVSATGDFTTDTNLTVSEYNNVSIKPWGETTTKFLVTPISTNMFLGNNANTDAGGNLSDDYAQIEFGGYTFASSGSNLAMFDRDENPVSGKVAKKVNCVGAVDAKSMLTSGALSLLPDGGWGTLQSTVKTSNDANPVSAASVIKLDYNNKATFNGEAVVGTFNNAFQLR